MSVLVHLARKEARDVRWHVGGALLLLAVLAFVFAWLVSDEAPDSYLSLIGMTVFWAIPSGAMLAGAAVAAELFAGDCASRRVDGAAFLPVPLSLVFRAKCVVVATSWMAGGVAMAVVAPLAALAFGPDGTAGVVLDALPNGALAALLTVPVVASIVVFSCVLEHGLGAVLAGLFAPGLVAGLGLWLGAWEDWGVRPEIGVGLAVCVPATVALVVGAWLAFTRGPIHLGVPLRRLAFGVGTGFGSIVATGVATGAVLDSRVDLAPGDPAAQAWALRVSPDGGHALVFVSNARTDSTSQVWSVRLADGRAVRLPGRQFVFLNWGAPGTVRMLGSDDASRGEAREIDLTTGALLPPIDAGTSADANWPAAAWNDRWARITTRDGKLRVEWRERGVERTFDHASNVVVSPVPGRFLVGGRGLVVDLASGREMPLGDAGGVQWGTHGWLDDGRLLTFVSGGKRRLLDCDAWEVREIRPPRGTFAQFGDGPWAMFTESVRTPREAPLAPVVRNVNGLVDVRTGREVQREGDASWLWFAPGCRSLAVVNPAGERFELVDCATGRKSAPVPQLDGGLGMNRVQELPDGRLLAADTGARLWLLGRDGSVVRRVFPPAE